MSDLNFGGARRTVYKDTNFISQCLLRHQGPIRKFSLIARKLRVVRKIEQWFELVSQHDIEELEFNSGYRLRIRSQSCLFNCKKLTHLKLIDCLLDLPPTFEGFMNLKELTLSCNRVMDQSSIETLISKSPLLESIALNQIGCSNITVSAPNVKYLIVQSSLWLYSCDIMKIFGDAPNLFTCNKLTHLDLSCTLNVHPTFEGFVNLKVLKLQFRKVDGSSIESLISKSPLLESLSLDVVSCGSNIPIIISAPKMKYLSLRGDLKNIGLEKSPVLVDMILYLDGDSRDCDLIKILHAAPDLEKLSVDLGNPYTEGFKFGCCRGVLSTTFSYLKVMTLDKFDLGESKAIQLVIELLRSAPNLEKLLLVIYNNRLYHSPSNEADSDFWQKEYLVGDRFVKLKVVEMKYFLCKAPQIEFAKFILSNSPILEKMMIGTCERDQATLTRVLKELLTLPRASTQVEVKFHDC